MAISELRPLAQERARPAGHIPRERLDVPAADEADPGSAAHRYALRRARDKRGR
jgi:hypothetical protein